MRLPKSAPSLESINRSYGYERLTHCIAIVSKLVDKYLTWDELCKGPAPEGLNHEEWWYGLKFLRLATSRLVGLKDGGGLVFRFNQPNGVSELLHDLDRGVGLVAGLDLAGEKAELRGRHAINALMTEAIASSQLEGAVTTREAAKELLRTGRAPLDRNEGMIQNTFLALQRIRSLPQSDLNPELIFELQRQVSENSLPQEPEALAILSSRLEAMCAFANGKDSLGFIHPIIRGIILHFWLVHEHPFAEGNGRLARALFYWLMKHQGYHVFELLSLSEVLHQAPAAYAESFLRVAADDNDLTHFIFHQMEAIRKSLLAFRTRLESKERELNTAAGALRGFKGLNVRQKAILTHALRFPEASYSIVAHQNSHGVTHQTARDDLFALAKRGLLRVEKQGRSYVFSAVSGLNDGQEVAEGEIESPPLPDADDRTLILGNAD